MATLPANDFEEEVAEVQALTLQDILTPGINLAERLDEAELTRIGQRVIKDVDIDEKSRGDWMKRYEKNLKIALQVQEAKNFPWIGCSNVKSPILTVAAIQFNAEAYPIIVDGSNLVKGRVLGPDPEGKKRARADRMGQHMTWQLLYKMPGWEDDTDKLLLCLPIVANVFRKAYYDSIENANRCEMVTAEDFIINNDAKSIETAPRYTHVLHYYPYEVRELVAAKMWVEVPVEAEEASEDDDALVDFYEQHRCLDLDEDGYPEHYIVTTTKEGKVARVVPCFGPEDIIAQEIDPFSRKVVGTIKLTEIAESQEPNAWAKVGEVVKIARRQYFVKYGFIPNPDGSFYDVGFGDLLQNTTEVIDRLQNQMIDAATLANAQGGFLGSGVNVRGGNFSFKTVGEWKRVDTTGGDLRANILPLSLPGPSPVSFNLLEMLVQMARDIVSSQDVVAGRAPANQPATTTLALIEQANTVKKGIFKRIHRAFGQELRILRRLNRDYLDEEEYFNLNDPEPQVGPAGQPVMGQDGQPVMTDAASIGREDYADEDLDVIPVSDPTQVTNMEKMARSEAEWQSFNGDMLVNQVELRRRRMEALGVKDIKKMLEVPPPAPDPKMLVETGKVMNQRKQIETDHMKASASSAKDLMTAAQSGVEIGLFDDAASLAAAATHIGGEAEPHEVINAQPDNEQGPVPGMEGPPGDGGIPPDAGGAPGGLDGGMGAGGGIEPGGPDGGGPAGPLIDNPI